MTRFVLHAPAAVVLAGEGWTPPAEHELLAPTLLRSQVLSLLHEAVHHVELASDEAAARRARIDARRVRLLGDAVLRRTAWRLADELGWASTCDAEYVALTRLQADVLVTSDEVLARAAAAVIATAGLDAVR